MFFTGRIPLGPSILQIFLGIGGETSFMYGKIIKHYYLPPMFNCKSNRENLHENRDKGVTTRRVQNLKDEYEDA